MANFSDRRNPSENKHQHDEQQQFKARNRRNKLFGLWIAEEHLALKDSEAEEYAKSVVRADFDLPGDEDMFAKVRADLDQAGKTLGDQVMKQRLAALETVALEQLAKE